MDGFVHFRCINLKYKLPSIPSFMLYLSVVGKSYAMKLSAKKNICGKKCFMKYYLSSSII